MSDKATLQSIARLVPAGSRVALLPGSPHNLAGHLDEVVALLVDWFTEHLRAAG